MPCLIIAEIGVNHNGSFDLAVESIDSAKKAGADIVKFQTFNPSELATEAAEQAEYQIVNTGKTENQLAMLNRLELSRESHHKLAKYCDEIGVEFLSTAFDMASLDFLVNEIGVKRLKIASGEITNLPFILAHAKTKLDIILSTGMATLSEIEDALGVIAFGYVSEDNVAPSKDAFSKVYASEPGQQVLRQKVTILHCTTEYPAPFEDINLNAIDTMANAFRLPVGYSDHSAGIVVAIAAIAKNVRVIEKHFTLNKTMEGPDHKASLEPREFAAMVQAIRDIELALGNGIKFPRASELKNKTVARKSLVAAIDINKGEVFREEMLVVKRPATGICPSKYWDLIGKSANQDYVAGSVIDE